MIFIRGMIRFLIILDFWRIKVNGSKDFWDDKRDDPWWKKVKVTFAVIKSHSFQHGRDEIRAKWTDLDMLNSY